MAFSFFKIHAIIRTCIPFTNATCNLLSQVSRIEISRT